jgi:hypothetical protein
MVELAEALKVCQDEKRVAGEALEHSKKELEKLQKTHEDDLSLIENLRKNHDRSTKVVEDLRANNADLARSLSSRDQRIQDLEKAMSEQRESSERRISEIVDRLKALFAEYEKSLNELGVRPAPLPSNLRVTEFMNWIDTELKVLPDVISGVSDFAASFSVESIPKLLHDFDCADLTKFRQKVLQFPGATSASIIRPNEDVQVIKSKFAREFWLASGKEAAKTIARAKLAQVDLHKSFNSRRPGRKLKVPAVAVASCSAAPINAPRRKSSKRGPSTVDESTSFGVQPSKTRSLESSKRKHKTSEQISDVELQAASGLAQMSRKKLKKAVKKVASFGVR